MKLFDLAMKFKAPDMQITLIDSKSRRVAFDGTVADLLEFSGTDYRKVARIGLMKNPPALRIEIE